MSETINHPPHYNVGKIEVIDAIEDWRLGFHEGNVVKYVARAKFKGHEVEDLQKALWYLDRRIKELMRDAAERAISAASADSGALASAESDIRSSVASGQS